MLYCRPPKPITQTVFGPFQLLLDGRRTNATKKITTGGRVSGVETVGNPAKLKIDQVGNIKTRRRQ